jgi:hypothetical protein
MRHGVNPLTALAQNLQQLTSLDLTNSCQFCNSEDLAVLSALSNLQQLQILDVEQFRPKDLEGLQSLPITSISIHIGSSEDVVAAIRCLEPRLPHKIEKLGLSLWTYTHETAVQALWVFLNSAGPQLRHLSVFWLYAVPSLPSLAGLTQLTSLRLDTVASTGGSVSQLSALTGLQDLKLGGFRHIRECHGELWQLRRCLPHLKSLTLLKDDW